MKMAVINGDLQPNNAKIIINSSEIRIFVDKISIIF